jgi:cytochrome c553
LSGLLCLAVAASVSPAHSGANQLVSPENPHPHFSDPDIAALRTYAREIGIQQPQLAVGTGDESHRHYFAHADQAALAADAPQIGVAHPPITHGEEAQGRGLHLDDTDFAALRGYAQQIGPDRQEPLNATPIKVAAARQFTPVNANAVGTKTCLFCHERQAELFGKTIMGRIDRTHPGKLDCESCHGPGSLHVQSVGCAACHGERGISKQRGMPSLVGLDPQYLVTAMKAYITGERKHELKRLLFAGIGDAELHNIAMYYARQTPARAQTPAVGTASAGRTASGSCAACHGAQGVSDIPGWPSLAGQDAQYLADATKAYKRGARNKVIACGACHGERGVSSRSGMPSLAGLGAEYLVAAMKAYVNGERKHELKRLLLAGVGDAELNNIANYYSRQAPARAQTSAVGDAAAGKTAAAPCVGCHNEQGTAVMPAWPILAGQDARSLADALLAYKNGSRSNEIHKDVLPSLDESAINNIAGFYASLTPHNPINRRRLPGGCPS